MLRGGVVSIEEEEEEDLSPDGATAQRIRAELAALNPLPDARFAVSETRDGRGLGLFVGDERIQPGTYLFDYKGKLIEQAEYDATYPNAGTGGPYADYAVGIAMPDGRTVYVDGARSEDSNIARYMNHDESLPNCYVWTLFSPVPRVLVFAGEMLSPGQEMVWDYGETYWQGRSDKR